MLEAKFQSMKETLRTVEEGLAQEARAIDSLQVHLNDERSAREATVLSESTLRGEADRQLQDFTRLLSCRMEEKFTLQQEATKRLQECLAAEAICRQELIQDVSAKVEKLMAEDALLASDAFKFAKSLEQVNAGLETETLTRAVAMENLSKSVTDAQIGIAEEVATRKDHYQKVQRAVEELAHNLQIEIRSRALAERGAVHERESLYNTLMDRVGKLAETEGRIISSLSLEVANRPDLASSALRGEIATRSVMEAALRRLALTMRP